MKKSFEEQISHYLNAKAETLFAEHALPDIPQQPKQVLLSADMVFSVFADIKKAIMKTLEESNNFEWYVMMQKGGKPTMFHPTYVAAQAEAKRLSEKEDGTAEILIRYQLVDDSLPF